MTLTVDVAPTRPRNRVERAYRLTAVLVFVLLLVSFASLSVGATDTSLSGVLQGLWTGTPVSQVDQIVLLNIRLPRLVMGLLVGAALAVSGVLMQGLFRNPLADPGIVGVSSGAGLGAILAIVLGGFLPLALQSLLGAWLVPVAAFLGAWGTTLLLYTVATRRGQTSVATMLLAGIAIGALGGALAGLMIYIADDAQLRELNFWGLGSLAGATWAKLAAAAPVIVLGLVATPYLARGLNALSLGEAAATHMGVSVQRVKNGAILSVAAATGAAVAVSGGIGFIGIVVPHLLRLATGPDHRPLLPNATLLGAIVLIGADMISRVIVAPSELPIGIITAVLGAPVFLYILLKSKRSMGL
ncbi:iron complex transport system permease protein [Epibacterium ulvae]|uniref:Iron complex transport system permease protein n=1 Tax=Epibacterium ulvae TaxID=1156985 RepID=A0A1G5QGS0_9RHOB|nr:iron ABC transporter permease [Epibacterium ulvae]SCZ60882.1 iron complex transport system permease protein [Epibacterium ulvae]